MLASNMMAQQYFYIKFIIQLTFITNGLSLIDAPHRIVVWIKKMIHDRSQKESIYKQKFQDDYFFDLGYNQSYCLVIFLNCLLFSSVVPVIPFFACLYFHTKYMVDKYNLVFVYFRKFESGGKIKKSVKNFMLFNLYFYMFVLVSFFTLKFPSSFFWWLGFIFIVLWTVFYKVVKHRYFNENEDYQNVAMQEIDLKSLLESEKSSEEKRKERMYKTNIRKLMKSYQHPFEHEDKSIYTNKDI